jgi:hypothetical protein
MTDFRSNPRPIPPAKTTRPLPYGDGDACFAAMQRHHERGRTTGSVPPRTEENNRQPLPPPLLQTADVGGDIIYGARAIALYLFGDDTDRPRRRVFNLWAHYRARREAAGFFKLRGALCLSKSRWRKFQGLGEP